MVWLVWLDEFVVVIKCDGWFKVVVVYNGLMVIVVN